MGGRVKTREEQLKALKKSYDWGWWEIRKLEEELNWLRFFYDHADFGPAGDDVVYFIKKDYEKQGNKLPEGYEIE